MVLFGRRTITTLLCGTRCQIADKWTDTMDYGGAVPPSRNLKSGSALPFLPYRTFFFAACKTSVAANVVSTHLPVPLLPDAFSHAAVHRVPHSPFKPTAASLHVAYT